MVQRFLVSALLVLAATASASDGDRVYRVTITNLTRAQVFSPPVLATHRGRIGLFEVGTEPSAELAALAENGMGGPIAEAFALLSRVFMSEATTAPIMPRQTGTYLVSSQRPFDRISVAGMLVDTNDAFFAVNGRRLPARRGSSVTYAAVAYDAGSEFNSEDCAFIPGPGCATGSMERDPGEPEGKTYVSNGIHGIGGILTSERYDWHNPVASVTVERIR